MTLFAFVRAFASVRPSSAREIVRELTSGVSKIWGISIGNTVLQNGLQHHLPRNFVETLPSGIPIAYAIIPEIKNFEDPLRRSIEDAFANSLRNLWIGIAVLGGIGLISSLFMREIPMHDYTDEQWGMTNACSKRDQDPLEKTP